MTEKLVETVCAACGSVFSPFLQWDRLRHPWAGWARLGMGLLFPFVVWSHDWLLIALLVMAAFSHPYWFPPCVDAGEDRHCLTKIVDAWQKWSGSATAKEKIMTFFPALVLFIPLVSMLWAHELFWGLYFFAAVVAYKLLFIGSLMCCGSCKGE